MHAVMTRSYDAFFSIASVIVAMLGSFAVLDLAGRVRSESGGTRRRWLVLGAAVVGLGIWSMHFIGTLAIELPVQVDYDVPVMLLSLAVAIATSLVALAVVSRTELAARQLVPAAILVGFGIAGVHYIGIASMRMAATVTYNTSLVVGSVLIAIVASYAGLSLAFQFRSDLTTRAMVLKMVAGVFLGAAISGMHYVATAAATFTRDGVFAPSSGYVITSDQLGTTLVEFTVVVIALALVGAAIDRSVQARVAYTSRLAHHAREIATSEKQYRLLFDHNPNPMWVYSDSTKAFLAVNEAVCARYGYARDEFLGMTRRNIRVLPPSLLTAPGVSDDEADVNGSWSGQHRRKDGTLIDVSVTSQPITFDGQEAHLALALDVTHQKLVDAALQQSEKRTRMIIDTALDAVVSMGPSGAISDWSAQAERMFGWSREEVIGRQMSQTIIPPRYRDAHTRGLQRYLETGVGPVLNKRIEVTAIRRDGTEFPIELAISPAKLGEEWSFSAFIRELTEQKKSEEAVKLVERRYHQLFEDMPVGLYRSTPEGQLIDVNPAMVAMLGYPSRDALLATPAVSLYVDPADRVRWTAQMKATGAVLNFDFQARRADGAAIWARDTTFARRDRDGAFLLYEGNIEDITARVEAEHAVKASERRLVQILEAAPLGIIVSDRKGHLTFANAGAQKLLGSGIVQGVGVDGLAEVYQAYAAGTNDFYPTERQPLVRALNGEASAVDDMEIRHGTLVTSLHVQGAPIVDNDGNVTAAVVAFFDTTDKRVLEAQLRQTSKMEAVGQLAGGVAHDFNNLLTVIMSYGAMLLEQLDAADPHRDDVQEIALAADRAAALTRQLLAFSRQQVMQPRVVSINVVISDIEKMLRRVIGEDVELAISLDPAVAAINADPGQLEQVLMNLVVNARDAMPRGGRLCISTSNSELSSESAQGSLHAPSGDYVMLAVSDTGTGMTDEVKQRLFDPFFTTKDQGRGTGLGLSMVYGIVKQSEGEIYVYSEVGQGSTFKIYFPRVGMPADALSRAAEPNEVPQGKETLLVVEDDVTLRTLAARVLKNCGYTVYVAAGGVEALEIVCDPTTFVDAVVTDVVMPGMNGRELLERLLACRPQMKSLLMSGYTDDDVLRRGVLQGQTAFLQKPFTPEQLARKVRGVLDREVLASVTDAQR